MEPQGEQFKRLVNIFFELTEAQDVDRLMEILLDGALSLVNAEHGSIYRLYYRTGQMEIVHSRPKTVQTLMSGVKSQQLQKEDFTPHLFLLASIKFMYCTASGWL